MNRTALAGLALEVGEMTVPRRDERSGVKTCSLLGIYKLRGSRAGISIARQAWCEGVTTTTQTNVRRRCSVGQRASLCQTPVADRAPAPVEPPVLIRGSHNRELGLVLRLPEALASAPVHHDSDADGKRSSEAFLND